jgi:hypothetical protein
VFLSQEQAVPLIELERVRRADGMMPLNSTHKILIYVLHKVAGLMTQRQGFLRYMVLRTHFHQIFRISMHILSTYDG